MKKQGWRIKKPWILGEYEARCVLRYRGEYTQGLEVRVARTYRGYQVRIEHQETGDWIMTRPFRRPWVALVMCIDSMIAGVNIQIGMRHDPEWVERWADDQREVLARWAPAAKMSRVFDASDVQCEP
jgi:hypothetical protein